MSSVFEASGIAVEHTRIHSIRMGINATWLVHACAHTHIGEKPSSGVERNSTDDFREFVSLQGVTCTMNHSQVLVELCLYGLGVNPSVRVIPDCEQTDPHTRAHIIII